MSIQTTIEISRQEAEQKIRLLLLKKLADIPYYSNSDLEDEIEEHFYNYSIV